eukprot:jgi/Botrbrau1/11512/Bobra.0198s0009.1
MCLKRRNHAGTCCCSAKYSKLPSSKGLIKGNHAAHTLQSSKALPSLLLTRAEKEEARRHMLHLRKALQPSPLPGLKGRDHAGTSHSSAKRFNFFPYKG